MLITAGKAGRAPFDPFLHGPSVQPLGLPAVLPVGQTALDDWRDLFDAVQVRLSALAADLPLLQTQAAMCDCLAAMGQLRTQLEAAVCHVQAELSLSRQQTTTARHGAEHDGLTALPNAAHFRRAVESALGPVPSNRLQPLSVMYLDLDGFKGINDHHGHASGDRLLRIVAARLRAAVRGQDTVARLGGDEFACLLVGVEDAPTLRRLAGKLFDAVSACVKVGAQRLCVCPSIGIACGSGIGADALLRRADAAMYRAKREQSGYAFWDPSAAGE